MFLFSRVLTTVAEVEVVVLDSTSDAEILQFEYQRYRWNLKRADIGWAD